MLQILSKMFEFFQNKTKRIQIKIDKYIELENERQIIKSDIDELADFFSERKTVRDSIMKSEIDQEIRKSVDERYDNFVSFHIASIGDLKRRRDVIEKNMNDLIKGDDEFLNLVEKEKENRKFKSILSKYRSNYIDLNTCDTLIKAISKKKVNYADNLVFNDKGELLLLKRSEVVDFNPGYYTLPGGHVDQGEDFETAAKRELLEEAGIKSDEVIEIGEYENEDVCIHYFRSDVVNIEPALQEEEIWSYEWCDPKELDKYLMMDNMRDNIIKMLFPIKYQIITIKKSLESGLINEKVYDVLIGNILEKAKIKYNNEKKKEHFERLSSKEECGSDERSTANVKKSMFNQRNEKTDHRENEIEKAESFKNNKTEDDIAVDKFFENKFEDKYKIFYEAVKKYLYDKWEVKTKKEFDEKFSKESKIKEVDIDDIIPTQKYVSKKIMEEKMDNDHFKTSKIQLLKFNDNYYLFDGHHRTSVMIEEKFHTVREEVLKLDKIKDFEKDIEKYLPEDYDLYDIVDKSVMSDLNKAFEDNIINETQYSILLEKAWKKQQIGTVVTHKDGKKYRKVSETGNKDQDWKLVSKDKTGTAKPESNGNSEAKQQEGVDNKPSKKDLRESAKNTSETALTNAVKQSPDPEVRQTAHEELKRRETEEKTQDGKDKKQVDNEKEVRNKLKEVNDNLSKLNDYLNEKYKDLSLLSRGKEKFKDEDYKNFISLKEQLTEKLIGLSKKDKKDVSKEDDNDYKMTHRPTDNGPSSDNVTKGDLSLPTDFYDHPEKYGNIKDVSYKESFDALKKIKDNPEAEITIYRSTIGDSINDGDWVTFSKSYAKIHNESNLDNKGKVLSLKVKAKDVVFAGDDIREFGYFPKEKHIQKSENMTEKEQIELLHKNIKEKGYYEEIPDWDFIEEDGKSLAEINKEERELKKSQTSDVEKTKDHIKGGLSDNMTIEQIAEKHGVSVKKITKQIKKGVKVEMEHTDDPTKAAEIARDHVYEIKDYYTRLAKMEDEAKKENKEDE